MRRFLLDSGIASDYINRKNGVFERARRESGLGNKIGTGLPIVGELAGGVEYSGSRNQNMKKLRAAMKTWAFWPFDEAAAMELGRIYATLRRSGRLIQVVDMQIAAIALTLGNTTIVSTDSDFQAIPGLPVENWAKP